MTITIDPGVITLAQTTFLQHLSAAITKVIPYAFRLLYIFTVFEVVIFGLIWALQQTPLWGKAFFKIIKIGLIFFILQNYVWLLDTIVQSFGKLAGLVVQQETLSQIVFNPAKIWQYGYDAGIYLLKAATVTTGFGLILIQTVLGIGILLSFGLFGIQLTAQIVIFYVTAIMALIFLPLGIFTPSRKIFDKALQAILQAGVRLMVIFLIVGIAIIVWEQAIPGDFAKANLNVFLGLFFSSLLFLCLAIYVPRAVTSVVGEFSSFFGEEGETPAPEINVTVPSANLGAIQVATEVNANVSSLSSGASQPAEINLTPSISIAAPSSGMFSGNLSSPAAKADKRSISDATLNKLAKNLARTLKKT